MGAKDGSSQNSGSGGIATVKLTKTTTAAVSTFKGRRVKRFKLVDEIGRGSMGRVFLAEDTVLKRHVALKLLPSKHRDGTPNHRTERLIREARSAATLEHPNAVTVFEIDESSGCHYIAMELVEGGNLEKLVQLTGPMEVERACQLIAEAAEVLCHAHERGIIHRDVKPANLLLTRNGRCKVADFGLALFDEAADAAIKSRCVGTPHFIAPEVAQGLGATPASDIYGLGCTLYFLLTGRPPYSGKTPGDLLQAHISEPFPDVRNTRTDIPDRLAQTIAQACAKDPQQRFEDAERFAKILRTFTINTGSSASLTAMTPTNVGSSMSSSMQMSPVAPTMTSAMNTAVQAMRIKFSLTPRVIWYGCGAVAAAALITVGIFLAKGRSNTATASPASSDSTPMFASAPAKPATLMEQSNVVKNGSMEQGDSAGGVSGWFIHERFKDVITVEHEAGNQFIRIKGDPTKTIFADQQIPVDPNWKVINVSARMRAADFKSGKQPFQDARLAFAFKDEKGNRVGNWPPVPALKDSTPWTERVVTVDVPANAKTLYLQLAIFNAAGTVDFDDIKVIPQKIQ
jgi:serine/threonine protein kinase